MKIKTVLLSTTCLISMPIATQAQDQHENESDWRLSLQAGGIFSPNYLGDDDYQLSVFPNFTAVYKDKFRASLEGLTYTLFDKNGFSAGPVAKLNFGRDEDGSNPLAITGENDDLVGLGDIDFTIEFGGYVQYSYESLSAKVELRQAISGHEGLVGEAELKYNNKFIAFGKTAFLSIGPELSYGDDSFNSAFFDVNATLSAASGLSQFDAKGGINSYGISASVVAPVTEKISIIGFGGYDRLVGDVNDSSLVQERGSKNQGLGGILISYQF